MKKYSLVAVLVVVAVVAMSSAAMAFTVTTGTGHELYDLIVTDFIGGAIGTTAGVVFIVVGAVAAALGKLSGAAWPLVGGGVLVAAPGLANSLGMVF